VRGKNAYKMFIERLREEEKLKEIGVDAVSYSRSNSIFYTIIFCSF
jgi:hypothetical protein